MFGNYLSRTELFNKSSILNTPWGHFPVDVFTLHNRWNYNETLALLGSSVITFTIVRDPVNQFESLYSYMGLSLTYGMDLKSFIRVLKDKLNLTDTSRRGSNGLFGRNQIAFDLGINPSEFDNEFKINKRIEQLDKQFDLVMIAERMEESLILLADLLCWPLEHVKYLELNVRKPEKYVILSKDERETLAHWLNVDSKIYNYFNGKFDDRIAEFNVRTKLHSLENQLKLLQQLNNDLKSRCVIQRVGNEKLKGKFLETNNNIMGYLIHL